MKLTNKEVQEIVARADDEYDRLKDIVHEQYDEIKRLKEEYIMLQNASDEVEEKKDREIERLTKGITEIIQYVNSLKLGSDEATYNKEGYAVDVYDIKKMLAELIGSDKE